MTKTISYIDAVFALHPTKQFLIEAGNLEDLTEEQYNQRYKEVTVIKDNLGENLSVLSSNPSDFKVAYANAKAKYNELKGG